MKKKLLLFGAVACLSFAGNAQYCTAGPSSIYDSNLQNLTLVGESSTITYGGCPGVTYVEDRTDELADLTILSTYDLDLTWGSCGGTYTKAGRAWIDFDGNEVFDADEVVGSIGSHYGTTVASYSFTVPADAIVGTTRMRVMVHESGTATNPCATFSWGSVTDFSIELLPNCTDVEYTASASETCVGDMVTLTGIGPGSITWDGGITDGVAFDPGAAGTYYYTPTSDDPLACEGEPVEIIVHEYPTVIANASAEEACFGVPVIFTGSGAATYVWDMGVTDGDPFTPGGLGSETYTVIGTNAGGCSGTASVDVNVNPVPVVDGTTSEDEICEGETIILNVSGDADYYEWDPADVTPGVAYAPADGVESFTVTGYFDTGCNTEDVITITLNPTPAISASAGDGIFCEDQSLVLSNGGDADITSWSPTDLYPGPGTYTYTVSGHYEGVEGCPATASVEITVVELPTITASSDIDETCLGGSVIFTASGADSYSWDMGVVDGMPYTPGDMGPMTYTVTGTDANGCVGTGSTVVDVVEGITITGTVTPAAIGTDGEINITVTGGISPYAFDWNNDGVTGDFDDMEDLTELSSGTYTVVVQGGGACEASKTFKVQSLVGVEDLALDNLSIYPNPTSNFININLEGKFNYQLHAINGDVMLNGSAVNQETISLEDFATGVYFVTLSNESGAVTMKVVKQ